MVPAVEYRRREVEVGCFPAVKGEREARWIGLVRPMLLLLAPPDVTVMVTGEVAGDDCLFTICLNFLYD